MRFRLETDRLVLREWEPRDAAPFTTIASDPRVMRWISGGQPWDAGRIEAFFARQRENVARNGFCLGALALKEDDVAAGLAGLQPLGRTGEVEVGWWLAPHLWGRGLATEAGRALLEYGFAQAGLARIVSIALPANRASTRVMERCGMRFERCASGRELGLSDPSLALVLYAAERPQ